MTQWIPAAFILKTKKSLIVDQTRAKTHCLETIELEVKNRDPTRSFYKRISSSIGAASANASITSLSRAASGVPATSKKYTPAKKTSPLTKSPLVHNSAVGLQEVRVS